MKKYESDYSALLKAVTGITEGVPYVTANLANTSAVIYGGLKDVSWAGFYLLEGDKLILGPFQGKPACIVIPMGRGVCGTAALKDETQLVPDVDAFPGHIACDSASRSEIVVPIHRDGKVIGVLDLDSTVPARFDEEDRAGLEAIVSYLEKTLNL